MKYVQRPNVAGIQHYIILQPSHNHVPKLKIIINKERQRKCAFSENMMQTFGTFLQQLKIQPDILYIIQNKISSNVALGGILVGFFTKAIIEDTQDMNHLHFMT